MWRNLKRRRKSVSFSPVAVANTKWQVERFTYSSQVASKHHQARLVGRSRGRGELSPPLCIPTYLAELTYRKTWLQEKERNPDVAYSVCCYVSVTWTGFSLYAFKLFSMMMELSAELKPRDRMLGWSYYEMFHKMFDYRKALSYRS